MKVDKKQVFSDMAPFVAGNLGSSLSSVAQPPAEPPPEDPNLTIGGEPGPAEVPQVQVAGLMGSLRGLGRLLRKAPEKIAGEATGESAARISKREAEEILKNYNLSKSAGRPVDDVDVTKTLTAAETTDDLKRLLDVAAPEDVDYSVRTWKDIENSDWARELQPVMEGTQQGLLTDRQQYGMRTIMVAAGEKAARLAEEITAGNRTPETLLEFQEAMYAFDSLYKLAKNNAREVARALNQQKMTVTALNSKSVRMAQNALEMVGNGNRKEGEDGIVALAELIAKEKEASGSAKAIMKAVSRNMMDVRRALVEVWKAWILSGIGTHATNVISVGVANTWETAVIRPLAATSGAIRAAVTGTKDRVYYAETLGDLAGAYVGLKGSLKVFAETFVAGESKFMAAEKAGGKVQETALYRLAGDNKAAQAAADATTISFRLLQAEDDAMRSVVYTSELYARAVREAYSEGLTGEKALSRAQEILDDPPVELIDEAHAAAKTRTFTSGDLPPGIGTIAAYSRALVGKIPELQFIVPFINTPANLLQYAMDTSILSVVSPNIWKLYAQGGAARDVAVAKVVAGTAFTAMVYQLYNAGMVSGDGPQDAALRKTMEASGWKPNSIKVGDKWYQIQRMEPFSTSIGLVANYLDKAKYAATEDEARLWMASAMLVAGETALDSSWLSSLNDFMEAQTDPKKWAKFAGGIAAGFVPWSGAVRTAEQVVDPVQRMISSDKFNPKLWFDYTKERMAMNIPILSEKMRPKRNWDGTVADPGMNAFAFAMSPVKVSEQKRDRATDELIKNGVGVREPSPVISLGGVEFSLLELSGDDRFYDAYLVAVGFKRRELVEEVISDSRYKELEESGPGSLKDAALRIAVSAGTYKGAEWFFGFVGKIMEEDPEVFSAVNDAAIKFGMNPWEFIDYLVVEAGRQESMLLQRETEKRLGIQIKQPYIPERGPIPLP